MNRRQREKLIPSIWIMASKQTEGHAYYALYAIDWKRGGRLSWEGWNQARRPAAISYSDQTKSRRPKIFFPACRQNCEKELHLHLNEAEFEELEQALLSVFFEEKMEKFHSNE